MLFFKSNSERNLEFKFFYITNNNNNIYLFYFERYDLFIQDKINIR